MSLPQPIGARLMGAQGGITRLLRTGLLHVGLLAPLLVACWPASALDPNAPESGLANAATTPAPQPATAYARHAVASAHPLATEAGLRILRAGGSAVDAAIAVQAMLGLVEPQSSGLGGGGFLLLAQGRQLSAWDGRETAPADVRDDLFLDAHGLALPFEQAVPGGRAVGVPGVLHMLKAVHQKHGRLPWARLFEPAITQAERGFPISPRLARQIAQDRYLANDPAARQYFFDAAGQPLPAGHRLRNPDYADLLRAVARQGTSAFYRGTTARAMVHAVQHAPAPGQLALRDLAHYRSVQRTALCTRWREYQVCGMPPPSAGMLIIGQMLGLLEAGGLDSASLKAPETSAWPAAFTHRYIEAARLALADRDQYIADPDRTPAPGGNWRTLWAPDYLARRAALIGPQAAEQVQPGQLDNRLSWAPDHSAEVPATSHFSIADGHGQVLAMTSSIESAFGARLLVNRGKGLAGGFLLNNQLTDFSFMPRREGHLVANRVAPGKRPRSSMSPTLVLSADGSEVLASLGSPGGPPIVHFVLKALLGHFVAGQPLQAAIDSPNLAPLGSAQNLTLMEQGRWPAITLQALRERGQVPHEVELASGVQGLLRAPGAGWQGAADARREGTVGGD